MRSSSTYVIVLESPGRHPIGPNILQKVLTGPFYFNGKVKVEVLAGEEWDELEDQSELLASEEVMF